MYKISSVILTYNEEDNIIPCIKSLLSLSDEVIVVDSYSTDKTKENAFKFPVQFYEKKMKSFSAQREFAISKAKHNWVFVLDADERVSEKLKAEINELIKSPKSVAYKFKRQNYFFTKKIRYSGWQSDTVIRLFDKNHCKYNDNPVHEEVIVNGKIETLKNKLDHHTFKSMKHYLQKMDNYAELQSIALFNKNKKITVYHLIIKPTYRFFLHFFIQLGFLDGKVGLIIAYLSALSVRLRYIKLWEKQLASIKSF